MAIKIVPILLGGALAALLFWPTQPAPSRTGYPEPKDPAALRARMASLLQRLANPATAAGVTPAEVETLANEMRAAGLTIEAGQLEQVLRDLLARGAAGATAQVGDDVFVPPVIAIIPPAPAPPILPSAVVPSIGEFIIRVTEATPTQLRGTARGYTQPGAIGTVPLPMGARGLPTAWFDRSAVIRVVRGGIAETGGGVQPDMGTPTPPRTPNALGCTPLSSSLPNAPLERATALLQLSHLPFDPEGRRMATLEDVSEMDYLASAIAYCGSELGPWEFRDEYVRRLTDHAAFLTRNLPQDVREAIRGAPYRGFY